MESELQRLGRLVVSRRKALGWPTRQAFADGIALTYRVLTDLENGVRPLGAKAYAVIEQALEWQPGSIDNILDGEDPSPIEPNELADRLRRPPEVGEPRPYSEDQMLSIIQRLLDRGDFPEEDREQLQYELDSMQIENFPNLYRALTREGKLKVVHYGQQVHAHESEKESSDVLPITEAAQSDASSEAGQGQEAGLQKPESPRARRIGPHPRTGAPVQLPGEDGADEPDVGNQL